MSAGALVPPGSGFVATRDRTLAEYVPVFLRWLGFVRQRRENTVLSYGEDLKTFLRFCTEANLSKPADVTFRHLEFYLGWLQAERGLKASSANHHVHALRTFWKWMVREEIADRNPAGDVFLLPTGRKLPKYLTIPEQERVLADLAGRRDLVGQRDYALVGTGLFAGFRCSELSVLELGHIDLEAGVLRVIEGKGRKDRELPIVPRLAEILLPYLTTVRPQLVGRAFGLIEEPSPGRKYWRVMRPVDGRMRTAARALSKAEAIRLRDALPGLPAPPYAFVGAAVGHRLRHAGQPLGARGIFHLIRRVVGPLVGRPVHPHMLRHSFASRLRENGADLQDIQEALGHSAITTTTMYAHLTTRRQREKLAEFLK